MQEKYCNSKKQCEWEMDFACDEPLPGAAIYDWECDPRINKCPKKQYPSNRKGALINFDKIKNNNKKKNKKSKNKRENDNKNMKRKRKQRLNRLKTRKWERQENRQSPTESNQGSTGSDQIDLQSQVSFEPRPSHYIPITPPIGNYYPHGAHLSKFSNSTWSETFLTEPGNGDFCSILCESRENF